MKKQLIKEILDIDKLLKKEIKIKEKSNNELQNLINEENNIEDKIKQLKLSNNKLNSLQNISLVNKLYSISIKKNKETTFIQNNLLLYKKQNEEKELELEKKYKILIEKSTKNEQIINKKKEELEELYKNFRRLSSNTDEQEKIIISPETMSIHLESKCQMEIDFLNNIKKFIKMTKIKNDKILKEIDSHIKILTSSNQKKESSSELSTGIKNSSHLENKDYILQKLEFINNLNAKTNIENNENKSDSSISMEMETNLNLDELPSDESLRFIDKVFDIKSNVKPIKIELKTSMYPPNATIPKEQTKKVEPIKIEKPVDYKSKENDIINKIDIIKKEIEDKKNKIEEIKNKKTKIDEKNKNSITTLNQIFIKIKIIKSQIDIIKDQIEDFSNNKKNGKYYRIFSINNIINNRNYCSNNNNEDNNFLYDMDTLRK